MKAVNDPLGKSGLALTVKTWTPVATTAEGATAIWLPPTMSRRVRNDTLLVVGATAVTERLRPRVSRIPFGI